MGLNWLCFVFFALTALRSKQLIQFSSPHPLHPLDRPKTFHRHRFVRWLPLEPSACSYSYLCLRDTEFRIAAETASRSPAVLSLITCKELAGVEQSIGN